MKSKDRGIVTGWRRLRGQDNDMFLISSVESFTGSYVLKLIKWYPLNMCTSLYVNYKTIKLYKKGVNVIKEMGN